jgi:GGDEF domain-containing protein
MTAIRGASGNAYPEVVAAWANRCRAAGVDPRHCFGPESGYLLSALHNALSEDAATADLGRAARSWGATFSAPVEALVSLSALRDVFIASVPADHYELVGEHMVREAVDAASNRLRAEARTDSLTGCANRFALSEDLARTVSSASRSGVDVSVAMVDLNGLKAINDTRGHVAGDLALQSLVENLSAVLRDADTLYRFGGDEFVVIAPFTDIAGAVAMLERAALREPGFSWGIASLASVGAQAVAYPEMFSPVS